MSGANHQYEVPGFFTLLLGMLVLLGMVWLLDRWSRRGGSSRVTATGHKTEIATASDVEQTQAGAETTRRSPPAKPTTGSPVATEPSGFAPAHVTGTGNTAEQSVGIESAKAENSSDRGAGQAEAESTGPETAAPETTASEPTETKTADTKMADTQLPDNAHARGKDDLTRIKGIGMKTSRLLNENGIRTYDAVAASSPDTLGALLREAGPMYASNDPQTWPEQATLAMRGQWDKINAGYGSNGVRLEADSKVAAPSATADSDPASVPISDEPLATDDKARAISPAPLGGIVRDDLTRIAGIGPKASELLRDAGIGSFAQLAQASPGQLKQVLDNGGGRFALLDSSTWGKQAKIAAAGQWDELTAMQYELAQAGSSAKNKGAGSTTAANGGDDLTRVEGIGPKIASLLHESGISTFSALAATPVPQLQEVLSNAGTRFALADPGTWPEQAALAASERWAELQSLQDQLDGGKRV